MNDVTFFFTPCKRLTSNMSPSKKGQSCTDFFFLFLNRTKLVLLTHLLRVEGYVVNGEITWRAPLWCHRQPVCFLLLPFWWRLKFPGCDSNWCHCLLDNSKVNGILRSDICVEREDGCRKQQNCLKMGCTLSSKRPISGRVYYAHPCQRKRRFSISVWTLFFS